MTVDVLDPANKKIVILGGGTAGWMAANLLQHHLAEHGYSITLLESPDIGIVGVGEGSTPHLKNFFHTLGIAESDWMPACHATFKNGISFKGWSSEAGYEQYFHPFPCAADKQTAASFLHNCMAKRHGHEVDAHPNHYFLSAYLAAQGLSPKSRGQQKLSTNYAYHFDSVLLGQYLAKLAINKGVKHIQGRCDSALNHPNGEIKCLVTDSGQQLEAEVFIDCSGFRSVLLQQHLNAQFCSYQNVLFNDAAVAIPSAATQHPSSQTVSQAMHAGWAWDIPLTSRVGNGYVYSSQFISRDQAEQELRIKLGMQDSNVDARHLKMKIGRVQQHWLKNCLAVGLSQGFIEPLEATALHLVQHTIESFVSAFIAGGLTQQHQGQFNQRINARFDGIRDYIVCHYKVNSRQDSQYWLANQHNTSISDSLRHILECWDKGADITAEINRQQIAEYYPAISWHCLLAGYGKFEPSTGLFQSDKQQAEFAKIQRFIQRCAEEFLPHQQALRK